MPKNLPVAETESLMLAYAQVNEQDIGQLAGRGALAAKDHQVETGRVPAKRFFLVAANAADTGSSGRRVIAEGFGGTRGVRAEVAAGPATNARRLACTLSLVRT